MTYGITGIKAGLGPGDQVPLRREIDEWWFSKNENDLNQRSLFILALQKFMNITPNPEDPTDLSFFSIAGIHGQPLLPWDTTQEKLKNYCAHGLTTFPTWHRPYMLLYEQRLYEVMCDLIPKTFASEDIPAMQHAADTWRLPFWDWAMKKPDWEPTNPDSPKNLGPNVRPNVPFILTQKNLEVKTKTGATSVPNPMWKFILPLNEQYPSYKTFEAYRIENVKQKRFGDCQATSRHPSTYNRNDPRYESDWVNGNELNWEKIAGELQGSMDHDANTLPEYVYRLFSNKLTYEQFGCESWEEGQRPKTYASLEDVHGQVHGFIGGAGQMGTIAVAAFDPVFWLHHCNIDRLLAMWQDLYDEKYLKWLNGSNEAKDDLAPFHTDAQGTYYDSLACSYQQKDLGYTYPELQRWLDKFKTNGVFDKQKYQTQLRKDIELKYSTTGKFALQLPEQERIATAHMSAMTTNNLAIENFPPPLVKIAEQANPQAPKPSAPPAASWEENDYVVNVVYDRFALGGDPYIVRIFLGDVPDGPPFYFAETPTEVGFVYNFSGSVTSRGVGADGCENCRAQREEGALLSGQVILTDYLVENITKERTLRGLTLQSLSREQVIEYLKKNLHWRISDRDDNTIPKENMPSLKISVAQGRATHYAEPSRFSDYQDYEVLWAVTEGRRAGADPGDLGLPA